MRGRHADDRRRPAEPPPTLAQLKKRHPRGSHEWQRINALVNDLFWIQGAWQISEKLCKGLRKEAGEPKLFENFEWLAKRAT